MRRRLIAGAVAVLAVAGIGLAAASTLSVASRPVTGLDLVNPCAGTAQATAANAANAAAQTFTGISVTLPEGCGTRAVQVTVLNGTTAVASGSGSITGSGTVSAGGTYSAVGNLTVQVTADGWAVPTTWSYRQFASCSVTTAGSTASCTGAVTTWVGQKPGGTASAVYFDVRVTTTSTTWVTWQVAFDLSHSYYGTEVVRLGNSDLDGYNDGTTNWNGTSRVNDVRRTSHCDALPALTVTGLGNGVVSATQLTNARNFSLVRNDYQRYFSLVVNRTEAGYSDVLAPGCGAP